MAEAEYERFAASLGGIGDSLQAMMDEPLPHSNGEVEAVHEELEAALLAAKEREDSLEKRVSDAELLRDLYMRNGKEDEAKELNEKIQVAKKALKEAGADDKATCELIVSVVAPVAVSMAMVTADWDTAKWEALGPLMEGAFAADKRHGLGAYTYANGDTYNGAWCSGGAAA